MVYVSTCFLPGGLKFWYQVGRGCLHDQPPTRTLGAVSPVGFPGEARNTIPRLLSFQGWRSSELRGTFLGGRDNQEPYTWISPEPTCVSFPYYPAMYITGSLYLRYHYSYTLNLVSSFSKLLHLAGMAGGGSWRCLIPYTTEFIWVKPR